MRPAQMEAVAKLLREYYWVGSEFHHGDCEGADVQAAVIADEIGFRIGCHPPINPKHRGFYRRYDFIYPEDEYIARDRRIVDETERLIATPHTSYEIVRSGTWTTVRYARSLNRPISIIYPNGNILSENDK